MSGIEFKSQRLEFFDIARFFAIFGVIIVHVGQNSLPSLFFGDLHNFGRFGVQLFFIISGATVYLTYNKGIKTSNYQLIFYIKRFFRIIPLFVIMAIIYFFLERPVCLIIYRFLICRNYFFFFFNFSKTFYLSLI